MNPETQKQLIEMLNAVASKLGTTGEHMFEVAVKQAYSGAIVGIIFSTLLLVGAIVGTYFLVVLTLRAKDARDESASFLLFLTAICVVIFGIVQVYDVYFNTLALLNPEFYAYKNIFSILSQLK